jgi:UDP-2,4-diacetamido-2,4,6-trideoxy-beta-L-altropyranose hydrolase
MRKNKKIACFRCDASLAIGSGHVMRCLTLAEGLKQNGWTCMFLSSRETQETIPVLAQSGFRILDPFQGPDTADILIVDHYDLDVRYEAQTRVWANCILVIDDLADRKHDCDILLDQTYGRKAKDYHAFVPTGCEILTGAEYALLRPQFTAMRKQALDRRNGQINRVLVSMGSTNIHNVTTMVLRGLHAFEGKKLDIDVVLGSTAPRIEDVKDIIQEIENKGLHTIRFLTDVADMASLMTQIDLALGAGGTTSWERCSLGLPSLIVEIADNQHLIANRLHQAGAVYNLGWIDNINGAVIAAALTELCDDRNRVLSMSNKAAQICDGQGVQRVLEVLG